MMALPGDGARGRGVSLPRLCKCGSRRAESRCMVNGFQTKAAARRTEAVVRSRIATIAQLWHGPACGSTRSVASHGIPS